MDHAVAENVYAGNAMTRRAAYQYGRVLPVGPAGQVDSAIGKATSSGRIGLIAPTHVIEADFEEHTIDGVRMIFQNTPGTEAPAEMNTYFPEWKILWAAENVSATIHNVYTLRGALVRDALLWSKHINEALYRYGREAEVMVTSHNWPRWGNERIREVLRAQRDAYANLNNQVLHLANQGVTINEIHNAYRVPDSLAPAVERAPVPWFGVPQRPGGTQSLPGLLGRQPGNPDAPVASRQRTAVRGYDGRRGADT